jgi:hypothetical protein
LNRARLRFRRRSSRFRQIGIFRLADIAVRIPQTGYVLF